MLLIVGLGRVIGGGSEDGERGFCLGVSVGRYREMGVVSQILLCHDCLVCVEEAPMEFWVLEDVLSGFLLGAVVVAVCCLSSEF